MYRGTTPTITINCDIDASEFVTMWVTFRVQKRSTYGQPQEVEITKRLEDEGVDVDGQVISITHLPQIAALGSTHYQVVKTEDETGTTSSMTLLNQEERIREIAQMVSGSDISEAAINNARQLLKL